MRVYFIDTSVLDNLLAIPHKCQAKEQAKIDFAERQSENAKFILPITAVIETGNHIAQLPQGDVRRNIAEKFSQMLELTAHQQAPWILHDFQWNKEFITELVSRHRAGLSMVDMMTQQVGGGDLCILTERELYKRATGITAEVWTYDAALNAYSR